MALRMGGVRLGMLVGVSLVMAAGQAWPQSPDALDQLRGLLPPDSALAFSDRTDDGQALVLQDVVIDLIWRSSQIRADRLSLSPAGEPSGVTIDLDGVFLRNASGTLAADHLALDGNAVAVLQTWSQTEAPNEDSEGNQTDAEIETTVDLPPGTLTAENLTIRASSQPPGQGWFMGTVSLDGLTPYGVDMIEADNLVAYAMGRIQASHFALGGLDFGWLSGISGWQSIVGGNLPATGLSLAVDDFAALDQSGQLYVRARRMAASLSGQQAPAGDGAADDELVIGRLQIDMAIDDFSMPVETLEPLPVVAELAAVLPEILSGSLRFAATVDGPAQELSIETGLIDLADIVYLEGGLALSDVSFAPDAPRMPLALIQMPGSIPMFSIAGGHLEAEDRGLIGKLETSGMPLPSASVDRLSGRLADRLPMLAGRLDGILAWLRGFEAGGRSTVRIDPATPAPAVELLSLMLINPDGVVTRLGLTN